MEQQHFDTAWATVTYDQGLATVRTSGDSAVWSRDYPSNMRITASISITTTTFWIYDPATKNIAR